MYIIYGKFMNYDKEAIFVTESEEEAEKYCSENNYDDLEYGGTKHTYEYVDKL